MKLKLSLIVISLLFIFLAISLLRPFSSSSISEKQAMEFLYGSMSLPDKADYSEQFYLDNVRASLQARREMPWGQSVPEREFLHFVLPIRVNNEALDSSRIVFYKELRDRVKNLSMTDAINEVNHWCHEKVTYQPSDGRTSSPLSSVSQAIGRCGEESTFTVAALRAVGIPARQIYTPRWAHTDDNHAWVEAWADGKWHFIGACEPEPILDLAWFNEPASRGILMSTNVTGDYHGPEEVLLRQPLTTRINVTANYAPITTTYVSIVDTDGQPVKNATVNFCIYNYAEYYRAVTKSTDTNGNASLRSGFGDLVVWATDGNNFGIEKVTAGNAPDSPIVITLNKDNSYTGSFEFDLVPPVAAASLPVASPEQRELNNSRLQYEDSIRNAYTATFATSATATALARNLKLDPEQLTTILLQSRGNHRAISEYLTSLTPDRRQAAVDLLLNITEKDRRDIEIRVIDDVINNCVKNDGIDHAFYSRYVLSPRIEAEYLRPWRKTLTDKFSDMASEFCQNPEKLIEWIAGNIQPVTDENPMNLRMSPTAVLSTLKADPISRNIFFVAAARSIGLPARIDPVTGKTQYSADGATWTDVNFQSNDNVQSTVDPKGYLTISFQPTGYIVDPKYYSQFSISKIVDGKASLLEFDDNSSVSQLFNKPYCLDAGQYILTTGQRMANGTVLASSQIFQIRADETTNIDLTIRQDNSDLSVIGSLNAENIYHDIQSNTDKSILSTTGRGYYILGLISPNHEPSTHALNDLSAVAAQLEQSNRPILLLFDDIESAGRFKKDQFPQLPGNITFGIDNNHACRREIIESLHLQNPSNPIFIICDTFNRIVWVSNGYTIGLGDAINNNLSRTK